MVALPVNWSTIFWATHGDLVDNHWGLGIILQEDCPLLSQMTPDVMTAPTMSAEHQWLFSAVGLMVTRLRGWLDASTIEFIQLLRSRLRAALLRV